MKPLICLSFDSGATPVSIPPPLPLPDQVKTVFFVAAPSRGTMTSAQLVVAPGVLESIPMTLVRPNAAMIARSTLDAIGASHHVSAAAPITVVLTAQGEPPQIFRIVLGTGGPGDDAVAVADGDMCVSGASTTVPAPAGTTVASYLITATQIGAELTSWLAQNPSAPRLFFAQFDALTNTSLNAVPPKLVGPVPDLLTVLKNRITNRWAGWVPGLGKSLWTPLPPSQSLIDDTNQVSEAFLSLATNRLGDPNTSSGFDAIQSAFESFSNGDLMVTLPISGVTTTQPSSANYFLFAELAFLAARKRLRPHATDLHDGLRTELSASVGLHGLPRVQLCCEQGRVAGCRSGAKGDLSGKEH
jgi:hypothetical protein